LTVTGTVLLLELVSVVVRNLLSPGTMLASVPSAVEQPLPLAVAPLVEVQVVEPAEVLEKLIVPVLKVLPVLVTEALKVANVPTPTTDPAAPRTSMVNIKLRRVVDLTNTAPCTKSLTKGYFEVY